MALQDDAFLASALVHKEPLQTLDGFDFNCLHGLNLAAVHDLTTCHFIDEKVAVLIAVPCGAGKSHLAQSLGHAQRAHDRARARGARRPSQFRALRGLVHGQLWTDAGEGANLRQSRVFRPTAGWLLQTRATDQSGHASVRAARPGGRTRCARGDSALDLGWGRAPGRGRKAAARAGAAAGRPARRGASERCVRHRRRRLAAGIPARCAQRWRPRHLRDADQWNAADRRRLGNWDQQRRVSRAGRGQRSGRLGRGNRRHGGRRADRHDSEAPLGDAVCAAGGRGHRALADVYECDAIVLCEARCGSAARITLQRRSGRSTRRPGRGT